MLYLLFIILTYPKLFNYNYLWVNIFLYSQVRALQIYESEKFYLSIIKWKERRELLVQLQNTCIMKSRVQKMRNSFRKTRVISQSKIFIWLVFYYSSFNEEIFVLLCLKTMFFFKCLNLTVLSFLKALCYAWIKAKEIEWIRKKVKRNWKTIFSHC